MVRQVIGIWSTRGYYALVKHLKELSLFARMIAVTAQNPLPPFSQLLYDAFAMPKRKGGLSPDGRQRYAQLARLGRSLPGPTNRMIKETITTYLQDTCPLEEPTSTPQALSDLAFLARAWAERHVRQLSMPFPKPAVGPASCFTHTRKQGGQYKAWAEEHCDELGAIPRFRNAPSVNGLDVDRSWNRMCLPALPGILHEHHSKKQTLASIAPSSDDSVLTDAYLDSDGTVLNEDLLDPPGVRDVALEGLIGERIGDGKPQLESCPVRHSMPRLNSAVDAAGRILKSTLRTAGTQNASAKLASITELGAKVRTVTKHAVDEIVAAQWVRKHFYQALDEWAPTKDVMLGEKSAAVRRVVRGRCFQKLVYSSDLTSATDFAYQDAYKVVLREILTVWGFGPIACDSLVETLVGSHRLELDASMPGTE